VIDTARLSSTRRIPAFVAIWLSLWAVVWALVVAIASVPAFRAPWSASRTIVDAGGLLTSEPLTGFVTPYASFARIRFGSARQAALSGLELLVVAGEDPVQSTAAMDSRTLATLPLHAEGELDHVWSGEPRQFDPAAAVRLALTREDGPLAGTGDVRVTVGYDGVLPAVRPLTYWWPWLTALGVAGFGVLMWPVTWSRQERAWRVACELFAAHRSAVALVGASAVIRILLAARGGQYFDADEARYLGAVAMFDHLSTGNVRAALDVLFESPDHPGFRVIGLLPASIHATAAYLAGRPAFDARGVSGEWLAAAILSMAAACSIALTYAIAIRAGASRKEGLLAAFLLACCASMLVYARHFYPYDAAMALCLLALLVGMKLPSDRASVRSAAAGLLAGLGFITYTGYWLLAGIVGILHVFQQPALRPAVRRALLFGAGLATLPAVLIAMAALRGRRLLAAAVSFSRAVTNGDFSEGWSLPWAYFWHIEHALLGVLLAGVTAAAWCVWRGSAPVRTPRWLLASAVLYGGLVVSSTVLHRFVVYDRLARQMLPFLCLATAAGFVGVTRETWLGRRTGLTVVGTFAAVFAVNALPIFRQEFPRDIALAAVRKYGEGSLRISSTLQDTAIDTVPIFLPAETDRVSTTARYLLLNGKDLWVESGRIRGTGMPPGKVLYTAVHPRQRRIYQYHGFTPAQRALFRTLDVSIKLIDTRPDEGDR
jgi:hypothetical protein